MRAPARRLMQHSRRLSPGGLMLCSSPRTDSSPARRAQLPARRGPPALPPPFSVRDVGEVGGLTSYGASLMDAYRQVGTFTGRILKGAKPADLPVVQSTKFELVINAQIARMLGLTIPASLLAVADEVIE